MLLKLVCSVLHVKYACALVLSMLLALISVSFEKYALVPSWVLHMHSPADDDTFLERGGLGRRHPILTVSVPSEWQANISISSFLAICSIADNGSVVIIYQVPLFSNSAKADGDSVRKRSLLQGISPVSHFTLPNLTVIAMDIKNFEGKLVCVVVSTFFIHAEADVTYSISLFDANAHKIWDKSAPVSPPAVEDIPTSIHIDARCDVSSKICGVVFINLPFHSNSNGFCYSTLALSLKTGELLWHFKPGESSASVKPVSISIMEKHWKLALLDQFKSHSHIEESTWGEYRESLMDVLHMAVVRSFSFLEFMVPCTFQPSST
ncbi:unnamed protein product [Dicrocoelium dendriticum]|nr:unnamed protein product [Dicrocoelium dendriticum]